MPTQATEVTCFRGTDPAWSATGLIAFRCPTRGGWELCYGSPGAGSVQHIPVDGGPAAHPRLPAWSPVRSSLAFVSDTGLFVSTAGAGNPRLVTDLAAGASPAWSPDGRHTAAVVQRQGGGGHVLLVTHLGGRPLLTVASPAPRLPDIVGRPVWRPR